jgi:2,6-dihydroxypseudooxynicotine hydrolase
MTHGKLDAVVTNWYPRFLANGIDWFDLQRTLGAVDDWEQWADAWAATADRYEDLGLIALEAGHRVTAAEHLRRAALTLQFAQFVLTEEPERRAALQQRMAAVYTLCAPLLDPPAHRYAVPYGGQRQVVGYLRLPPNVEKPGVVILLPGLESTKEQFSTYEPYFLRRGVATLSVEGPGQGEGALTAPFRDALYGDAIAAVGESISARQDIDPTSVVVLGTSFGGYLALRHATRIEGLRGVVDIAGPYDLRGFAELQEVTRDGFREFVAAADEDEARKLLDDVTLDGVLGEFPVPVFVVHGEQDRIIDVSHAHRIISALPQNADVRLEREGNHSCNNVASIVRPAVADWVADRLAQVSVTQSSEARTA